MRWHRNVWVVAATSLRVPRPFAADTAIGGNFNPVAPRKSS